MKNKVGLGLAALAFAWHGAAAAPGSQFYAQAGFSDYGYTDDGLAIKLGADFAPNLGGLKYLGLTAFYVHTDGDDRYFGDKLSYETDTFALGPAVTFPLQGTKLALQGRAYLELDRVRAETRCCERVSDNDMDVGLGFGVQYTLDQKMSFRVDYDELGNSLETLTVGIGFKF
jgi:opacity protein-like surface antigen